MWQAQEIIATKRDGGLLSREQIEFFIDAVVSGDFKDYQASALLMAIVLNGMSSEETVHLTEAMLRSGKTITLDEIDRPTVDKHSTGGVGDKVSLILAPLAASVGLCVPMMSGRGLGHTGGTLDKLESIPGFRVDLNEAEYRSQLAAIHQAMIGQSSEMVPADKILYALRDVTATVGSIPLISSSILSKKLAEGIDGLVLDVKCGSGAFMPTEAKARELAESLVDIARRMGCKCSAVITAMDQPLGYAVGNALEVAEAIDCLRGEGAVDLMEVSTILTAEMMRLGGLVGSREEAQALIEQKIESGDALDAFESLVDAQGGDSRIIKNASLLPQAASVVNLSADRSGFVQKVDARLVGEAVHLLGAGRSTVDGSVDPAVGVILHRKVGLPVRKGESLCSVHYNDSVKESLALEKLRIAFTIGLDVPEAIPLILDILEDPYDCYGNT